MLWCLCGACAVTVVACEAARCYGKGERRQGVRVCACVRPCACVRVCGVSVVQGQRMVRDGVGERAVG